MAEKTHIIRELERRLKDEYNKADESDDDKLLIGFLKFNEALKKKADLKAMLTECGMTIYRLFPFKEIGIGLWNPADCAYRYEFLVGHSPAAQEAHKNIKLSLEDMMDGKDVCYLQISKYTQFNFTEGLKDDPMAKDEALFNRPSLLASKRQTTDIMLEGDYFDTYMFNQKDEMIGWFEVCNTKDNKMPSMKTMKWLEAYAALLAHMVEGAVGTTKGSW